MKQIVIILLAAIFLSSCGSSKSSMGTATKERHEKNVATTEKDKKLFKVISRARSFEGTPYKYGGTTSRGMDCSGLIYTCYLEEDINLPRTSKAMSKFGEEISRRRIKIGDLVFFRTNKSSRKINHVGLVVETTADKVYFIHSTSSRGVIISSLDDFYWKKVFVMVRRVI